MIRRRLGAILVTMGLSAFTLSGIAPTSAAPAQRVSIKTDWGIISVPVVKAPKPGKCVKVNVKVDVRNAANAPKDGVNMGIVDDFDNLIAYSEWTTFVIVNGQKDLTQTKPNGVYTQPMTACAKPGTWADPYRAGITVPLVAAKAKESYVFTVITSLERLGEGEVDYVWKK